MKKVWLGLAGLALLGACSKEETLDNTHPCNEYSLYNCTETVTKAPVEVQIERLHDKLLDLREQVEALQSLPTAKKEKEAADKARSSNNVYIYGGSLSGGGGGPAGSAGIDWLWCGTHPCEIKER